MHRLASLALLCAVACSSSPQDGRGTGPGGGTGKPSNRVAGDGGDAGERLTREDCLAILDHFLEVMLEEKRQSGPPEEVPTDEQVSEIKSRMEGEVETCVGDSRVPYDCVMAATSTEAINACLDGDSG